MRLLRFYIGEYRVLSKLDIHFDPPQNDLAQKLKADDRKYHLDFLVGVNGTGKSTVLRLLRQIFLGASKSFDELRNLPFILEYWLDSQQKKVRITNIHPQEKTLLDRYFVTTINGLNDVYETDEPDEQHLVDSISDELLPRGIAYTTGNEVEWQENQNLDIFDNGSSGVIDEMPQDERAIKELPGWMKRPDQDQDGKEEELFRFISQNHLVLVALTGLLLHHTYQADQSPLQDVFREIDLKQFAGFSLQFDLSYASEPERNGLWERFGQYASRTVRSGGKFLMVFDLTDADLAERLLETNGGALALFKLLAGWYSGENRILSKVNLFLERASNDEQLIPPLHTWDWLSDGERSFLGRMCLFLLFGEIESLILLDEPEVHFNDYWKRHIVSIMHRVFEKKNAPHVRHVLVATHSSISLSDVHPDDILILERQNLFTSATSMPRIQTFGADPSEIMIHVFGTPHAAGQYSVSEIGNWLEEALQKSEEERREYLNKQLKKVAPGYWAYRIRREMVGLPL